MSLFTLFLPRFKKKSFQKQCFFKLIVGLFYCILSIAFCLFAFCLSVRLVDSVDRQIFNVTLVLHFSPEIFLTCTFCFSVLLLFNQFVCNKKSVCVFQTPQRFGFKSLCNHRREGTFISLAHFLDSFLDRDIFTFIFAPFLIPFKVYVFFLLPWTLT